MSAGEALLALYDRMKCGAVLLDPSGYVLQLNSSAERYLSKHNGSAGQQIGQEPQRATRALRQLLGGSIRIEELRQAPRAVRNSGNRPLIAHIRLFAGLEGEAVGLLTLVDLDECLEPSGNTLQAVFGLTKAEARLACELACGDTIEDIAEEHGVSISTARVQLKSIFAKTGTSRQAELVALLTRLKQWASVTR